MKDKSSNKSEVAINSHPPTRQVEIVKVTTQTATANISVQTVEIPRQVKEAISHALSSGRNSHFAH